MSAHTDLLLELLDLAVAVNLLFSILLLPPHVAFHQLNGRDERLRYAEVSVLLHTVGGFIELGIVILHYVTPQVPNTSTSR